MLVTVGYLKPSKLQFLNLLFRRHLTHHSVGLVPWSPIMSLLVLLSLLMMIWLFLLQ